MNFNLFKLFKKETINLEQFDQKFLWPFLDELNENITTKLLRSLENEESNTLRTKDEVKFEVAIWLNHIVGKSLSQIKILGDQFSPNILSFGQRQFKYLFDRWGNNGEFDVFVNEIKTESLIKIKKFHELEIAYSNSGMTLQDFESCTASIILGINYKLFTNGFIDSMSEIHRFAFLTVFNFMKKLSKKYKVATITETELKTISIQKNKNQSNKTPEQSKNQWDENSVQLVQNLTLESKQKRLVALISTKNKQPEDIYLALQQNLNKLQQKDIETLVLKETHGLSEKEINELQEKSKLSINYTENSQESPSQFKERARKEAQAIAENLNQNVD